MFICTNRSCRLMAAAARLAGAGTFTVLDVPAPGGPPIDGKISWTCTD